MERVLVSEATPSASMSESRIICRVCQKQFSLYTCPRCNTRYCSLQCYKRHSLRCTESFMRENVMEELQLIQPEDETKKKMLDILKRFHSEEEEMNCDDEDDSMLSEETVQKVLSGEKVVIEDLSSEEIKQFCRAIASGELSKMIEPWNPWWRKPSARFISLSPEGTQLIRPLHEQDTSTSPSDTSEIPTGPESSLPPLGHLIRASPSPLLPVHLVDVLYSYCFTLRLYNGEWKSDPLGAATVALSVSAVLGDGGRPETVAEALMACLETACSPVYRQTGGFRFGIGLVEDVVCLLYLGGDALVCLLCDMQRLLSSGERILKSEKRESVRKLRGAERKVYFLMCWVHEQPREAWASLAGLVEIERASLLASGGQDGGRKPSTDEGTVIPQGKVLIEEV